MTKIYTLCIMLTALPIQGANNVAFNRDKKIKKIQTAIQCWDTEGKKKFKKIITKNPGLVNNQKIGNIKNTPLLELLWEGYNTHKGFDVEHVTFLLENNADPNLTDKRNAWTPLSLCAFNPDVIGSFATAQILLNYGADPNLGTGESKDKLFPLVLAAQNSNNIPFIELLLKNNADRTVTNAVGETPEEIARKKENFQMADFIRDYEPELAGPPGTTIKKAQDTLSYAAGSKNE